MEKEDIKIGDIVVRFRENHAGMKEGDISKVIDISSTGMISLKDYSKSNETHAPYNLRLATEEEINKYEGIKRIIYEIY